MTADELTDALRRAFSLGQTYWMQADSEYESQHKKSDKTMQEFRDLIAESNMKFKEQKPK